VEYAWIDAHRDQYNVSRLCRVLRVSRSVDCQWRVRRPTERRQRQAVFDDEVARLHALSRGCYGRPRLVKAAGSPGYEDERGARAPQPNTSRVTAGVPAGMADDHRLGAPLAGGAEPAGATL
jgi:hypothetical protein